jgi:hypothetical protein
VQNRAGKQARRYRREDAPRLRLSSGDTKVQLHRTVPGWAGSQANQHRVEATWAFHTRRGDSKVHLQREPPVPQSG